MSLKLALDLVVLLAILAITATTLSGWGNLTWRVLGIEQPTQPSVVSVWLGFCMVVALLEIIHLFTPLAWPITLVVVFVGISAQIWRAQLQLPTQQRTVTEAQSSTGFFALTVAALRRYPLRSLVAAAVILVWCLRAMQTPTMFDSGLYHFGSIRWLNEYAIVPGLGNLHWRLALNQSYFGFLALLNIAPYWGKGYATGGLFLLVLTAFTLLEIGITRSALWRWIFGGILFSYLCLLSGMIANPLPDTAVALLQITIFVFLSRSLRADPNEESAEQVRRKRLQVALVFLCLTIVTIKLSSVGFAVATLSVVLFSMFRSVRHQLPLKLLLSLAALVGLFAVVHIARGYLLSGAPFFPSPLGWLWPLPWAVEPGVAQNESQLIYAWAKQPGITSAIEVPAGYGWLLPWLLALPTTLKFLFLASSLQFVAALIVRRVHAVGLGKQDLLVAAPIFGALVFWFFSAPDPRFLGANVVLYFAWSLWFFCTSFAEHPLLSRSTSVTAQTAFNRLTVICAGLLFVRWSLAGLLPLPVGWATLPVTETSIQANRSGLKAFVPTNGTQCWNSDLPCAVLLHGGLLKVPLDRFGWFLGLQSHRFGLFIER
jgi:hypothetical protein